MTEDGGRDIGIDARLLRLASDPLRLQALSLLNERTAGVSEVAEELGISAAAAAGHLEEMRQAGLVEVAGEVFSRGAVESRYRAIVRALWSEDEWEQLSMVERRKLSAWILGLIHADASESIESGLFDTRPEAHVSRTISRVDEQGWRELNRIQDEVLEASFAIQAESAERLAESGEDGAAVMTAMICCELPR